ncbi:23S rRNA (guanine745-N1)-methyltransferase [Psychrobacillus sp. OK028]|uniref:class I SAM-dependent methyltransferase n=1 Tax=Psychrobacillus sp. OK028 TaxID=1884359 RepID=UPI00088BA529|nr:class I SAM-dependent methyltransferase [Psychrobacillus sp. OK028]SDO09484.1 23S rRNA (guanine745-N1)-methyltransferase [Psychrobacillus sp. OK028]
MTLLDPTKLSGWLSPHSIEWYHQLSELQRIYTYPWNNTLSKPNGESIFDEEVRKMVKNRKVLDVGCGHGEFTFHCSSIAKEIIGFDVTENFLEIAKAHKKANLSFVVGNIKQGLPFEKGEFDSAYIRKGPTSAYSYLTEIVRKGGTILGLHPGDESGKELPQLFPDLFQESSGTPILDKINGQLGISSFTSTELEHVTSTEYLHSPLDVLKLRCFGQTAQVFERLKKEDLVEITRIFDKNRTEQGLAITFSRYIVRLTN